MPQDDELRGLGLVVIVVVNDLVDKEGWVTIETNNDWTSWDDDDDDDVFFFFYFYFFNLMIQSPKNSICIWKGVHLSHRSCTQGLDESGQHLLLGRCASHAKGGDISNGAEIVLTSQHGNICRYGRGFHDSFWAILTDAEVLLSIVFDVIIWGDFFWYLVDILLTFVRIICVALF